MSLGPGQAGRGEARVVLEACLAATRAAGAGSDQEESSRASEETGRGGEGRTKRNETKQ